MKHWLLAILSVIGLAILSGCETDPITTGEPATPAAISARTPFTPTASARP